MPAGSGRNTALPETMSISWPRAGVCVAIQRFYVGSSRRRSRRELMDTEGPRETIVGVPGDCVNSCLRVVRLRTSARSSPTCLMQQWVWIHLAVRLGIETGRAADAWPVRAARSADIAQYSLRFGVRVTRQADRTSHLPAKLAQCNKNADPHSD